MQRTKDPRPLVSILSFTFFGVLQAQITIDQNDMPSAGDISTRWTATLQQFDSTDTGPNHVWDFGSLEALVEGADTCVAVSSTPFLYQFYFNNPFIYPDHDADYAVSGQDFDFQILQLTEVFDYFKRDADGFDNVGFGANISGLPSSVQRVPVDHIYELPLNFGDVSSSPSTWEITVPTLLFFRQEQVRTNVVDGWGTLYLPTDTFQVLRVASLLERTDSIFIDQFGFGFTLPEPPTVEYKWLAEGMDVPVLQVNTTAGVPGQVRFWLDPAVGIEGEATMDAGLRMFPQPASDLVHVNLPGDASGTLSILDASGRVVRTIPGARGVTALCVDVSALAPGLYHLQEVGSGRSVELVVAR